MRRFISVSIVALTLAGITSTAFAAPICRDLDNDGDCDLTQQQINQIAGAIVQRFHRDVPSVCIGKLGITFADFDRLKRDIAEAISDVQDTCEAAEQ